MPQPAAAPHVWLVRHGETEWSRDGRHTGRTDVPLTAAGEEAARALAPVLASVRFDVVACSPRLRARRTAELAGFETVDIDDDLAEWDYGDYEGLTRVEIRKSRPNWSVWTDGCPGGESPRLVSDRADRVIARLRTAGTALVFSHGHFLRALTARWVGQSLELGARLELDTGRVSVLGDDRGTATLELWNGWPPPH